MPWEPLVYQNNDSWRINWGWGLRCSQKGIALHTPPSWWQAAAGFLRGSMVHFPLKWVMWTLVKGDVETTRRKVVRVVMRMWASHLRFWVSRIITSTSQLPTPGPPRRDLDGRTRFWRVFAAGAEAAEVLSDELALSIGAPKVLGCKYQRWSEWGKTSIFSNNKLRYCCVAKYNENGQRTTAECLELGGDCQSWWLQTCQQQTKEIQCCPITD